MTHTISDTIHLPGGDKGNVGVAVLAGGLGTLIAGLPTRYYVHEKPGAFARVADGASAQGIEAFRFRIEPGEFISFGTLDVGLGPEGWRRDDEALNAVLVKMPNMRNQTFTFRPPVWTDRLP